MNKKFLYAVSFAAMMTSMVLTGCKLKYGRDDATEAKLVGEWVSHDSDLWYDYNVDIDALLKEFEAGFEDEEALLNDEEDLQIANQIEYTSIVAFSEDLTFTNKWEVSINYGNPQFTDVATISSTGTWDASKDTIRMKYDEDSFEFDFTHPLLESNEKEDIKAYFLDKVNKDDGYQVTIAIKGDFTDEIEAEEKVEITVPRHFTRVKR